MNLTEQQIDFLESELEERGITVPSLKADLLDHFCCAIESSMETGTAFEDAFHRAWHEICPDGVREFDLATKIILLQHKYATMKKITFIIGFITALAGFTGYFFKINHWPWANNLIVLGFGLFTVVFLPLYFYLKFRSDTELGKARSKPYYIFMNALTSVICLSIPYATLHWPGGRYVIYACFLLSSLVFFPMVFLNWYKNTAQTPEGQST